MNLIMLRHGKSMANSNLPVNSEQENLLTSEGLAVLLSEAMAFREKHPHHNFDHVVCSSFPRAVQTCYNFLSTIGNPSVPVEITDLIVERDFGTEGKFLNEVEVDILHGKGHYESWFKDLDCKPCGKGETVTDLYQRVSTAYDSLVLPRLKEGKNVLVVGHFASLAALSARVKHNDWRQSLSSKFKNSVPRKFKVDPNR